MYVGKSSVWNFEVSDRRDRIPLDLCPLAAGAASGPGSDVTLHAGPNELGGDGLTGALHTWVAESVNDFEYSLPPSLRHEWSRRTVSNVDYYVSGSYIDFSEV